MGGTLLITSLANRCDILRYNYFCEKIFLEETQFPFQPIFFWCSSSSDGFVVQQLPAGVRMPLEGTTSPPRRSPKTSPRRRSSIEYECVPGKQRRVSIHGDAASLIPASTLRRVSLRAVDAEETSPAAAMRTHAGTAQFSFEEGALWHLVHHAWGVVGMGPCYKQHL